MTRSGGELVVALDIEQHDVPRSEKSHSFAR
jgi:hypothetical protein